MSKKDRNATKAKRMEEKKKIKLEKKREKLNVLKVFGICLCFFAIIRLVGILYITTDYRAQKSTMDKYFSAVQNMDYDSLSEVVYPPYLEKFEEYKDDDNFKDFYTASSVEQIAIFSGLCSCANINCAALYATLVSL